MRVCIFIIVLFVCFDKNLYKQNKKKGFVDFSGYTFITKTATTDDK